MWETEDETLLDRLMSRDEDALREVIATFGPLVNGIARRVLTVPSMAEEVSQDTFLALWRRPGSFDPSRGSLQAFLCGIARNKAIDLVRKEESRHRTKDALMAEAELEPIAEMPPIEESQRIRAALMRLSLPQREALVLAYFGGRTYREVAGELGIPEGTAKTRLRDGLTKLRILLAAKEEM